jgi:signal transduction histidine kinase
VKFTVIDQDKTKDQLIAEVTELDRKAATDPPNRNSGGNDDQRASHALKMEAIGRLAGGIAHDFNNILTAIQGNAELLQMDGFPKADRVDMLAQILEASKRATSLNRQLLDFAHKGACKIVSVDTTAIIEEAVALLNHGIDKRIDIRLDMQADPPHILADPSQIKSVLLNLGVSACDTMPDGGVLILTTRNIVLDDESRGDYGGQLVPGPYVEICVCGMNSGANGETDNGVCEPVRPAGGTGKDANPGLAGVYDCIKSLYGNIQADIHPGQETAFRVLLHSA